MKNFRSVLPIIFVACFTLIIASEIISICTMGWGTTARGQPIPSTWLGTLAALYILISLIQAIIYIFRKNKVRMAQIIISVVKFVVVLFAEAVIDIFLDPFWHIYFNEDIAYCIAVILFLVAITAAFVTEIITFKKLNKIKTTSELVVCTTPIRG